MPQFQDLTGQRFGKLIVIERAPNIKRKVAWVCKCDCGNIKTVTAENLKKGCVKSCGCNSHPGYTPANFKDLTGQRFGKLTVIERVDNKSWRPKWRCLCDCGNEAVVQTANLTSGGTISCGCNKGESHPDKIPRLYKVWKSMKARCLCPSSSSYKRYGARGISICDEWLQSYNAFQKWAIESGYDENAPFGQCTIDRINPDGNYEPSNCRWVDVKFQANNRRNSKKLAKEDA